MRSSRRLPWALVLILLAAAGVRLVTWSQVFGGGEVILDGTDGYYHLRRALLTVENWPRVVQFDHLMSVPDGARIQWPPLFDWLLATASRMMPGEAAASVELAGAAMPPALGLLQVAALAWLLWRLAGPRAAAWGAGCAAVLPGVVRYSLLGALDHDPLIELEALLVLVGIAGLLGPGRWDRPRLVRHGLEIGLPLAALMLTWAGAVIHVGLFATVVLAVAWSGRREGESIERLGVGLALGSSLAALLTLPFVLSSVWTATEGATFMGLSWLQPAALLGLALLGGSAALVARRLAGRRLGALLPLTLACGAGLAALLPISGPALLSGIAFLGRGEPFVEAIAESRPLLRLFGELDLRPLLVRLSVLPLCLPILLPWLLRRPPRWRGALVAAWALYALAIALVQARYSHGAGLAVAALFGLSVARALEEPGLSRRRGLAVGALGVIALPTLAAYLPLPGFGSYRLWQRPPPVVASGMDEVCRLLRAAAPPPVSWRRPSEPAEESVLAPWETGHWVHWLARKATVANPFGPQGQPGFRPGVGFYFLEDERQARQLLQRHRVRWVVVDSDPLKIELAARLAGLDPRRFIERSEAGSALKVEPLRATVGGRLAFGGTEAQPLPLGYREIFRAERSRVGPFGQVPTLRVFEVAP